MPGKILYEEVETRILSSGDHLISESYENNKQLLEIRCGLCDETYEQTFDRFKRGYKHNWMICPKYIKPHRAKPQRAKPQKVKNKRKCVFCKREFISTRKKQKLCNMECRRGYEKVKAKDGHYKRIGRIGGRISVTKQSRRSKNEKYFYDLCVEWFGQDDVKSNPKMFDGWDADIVIVSYRMAVSWNGVWHYKQICKNTTVESIQKRDSLKEKAVNECGYNNYVIKDMGSHNKKFVEEQFELFKLYLIEYENEHTNMFYYNGVWLIDDLE